MERYVCIHGHFYQPPRENPWLEVVELQDSAHPYHDWNERITAECYAPNAVARILDGAGRIRQLVNNYASISFNFGPTLLAWLQDQAPEVYRLILQADQQSRERFSGHGSALAQVYNHVILPLANRADKETQVRWGIRDFQHRFGRRPEGLWLAETAVDLETLEVLAQEGIRFTILSPYQAGRVRPISELGTRSAERKTHKQEQLRAPSSEFRAGEEWTDVTGGTIDPKVPYLQKLPSGRSIALFFYDGPISRAVAFEGVLRKGETLAQRLMSAFTDQEGPQLVHVATDGESYGHHAVHGDMALAYALHFIESNQLARLTNYGEMLERHPPQWEVEIIENSSWSCAHGIERWRSDCGCNSGRPGWRQQWRGPLRAALDFLRDSLAPRYHEAASKLFRDPWQARDGYVDVILERSTDSWKRFLAQHGRKPLTPAEQIRARKLLELQRQTQLTYTSCGWFFDEISGLETTQVLAYAGRALHLAEEVLGVNLQEPFLQRLEEAPSNLPEHGNGRVVYEKMIRPMRVDSHRITAHYAVSSLFEEYPEKVRMFCYEAEREEAHSQEAGKVRLKLGRVHLTSLITGESAQYTSGAIHFGDHNVNGGVASFKDVESYHELVGDFARAFERVDVPTLVRLLDRHFGESTYSLESLFRDEQRRVLQRVLRTNLAEIRDTFGRVYEQHLPIMRFLRHVQAPLPRPYQLTADLLFNTDLRWAFEEDSPNLDHVRKLVQEATGWGVELPRGELGYRFGQMLRRFAERWRGASEQLEPLRALAQGVELAQSMPFEVDLWVPQNVWFEVGKSLRVPQEEQAWAGSQTAGDWLADYRRLGELLKITPDRVQGTP